VEPAQANAFNATQLQAMIRLYERIQNHVFRFMPTDAVPKVSHLMSLVLTCSSLNCPKFLAIQNWVEDFDPTESDIQILTSAAPQAPPGLNTAAHEETGGTCITAVQQVRERPLCI
jgi:GTPase-activating protein SST2